MNNRPTPETDAAEFPVMTWPKSDHPMVVRADFARTLERERDEALNEGLEQARLLGMSGEREAKLITERDEALRLLGKWEQVAIGAGERVLELTRQRDAAISIGLDAVGQLIDLHHTTSKRERNVEWECRADLLDRNFRKLEDLLDSFGHPEQTQP